MTRQYNITLEAALMLVCVLQHTLHAVFFIHVHGDTYLIKTPSPPNFLRLFLNCSDLQSIAYNPIKLYINKLTIDQQI